MSGKQFINLYKQGLINLGSDRIAQMSNRFRIIGIMAVLSVLEDTYGEEITDSVDMIQVINTINKNLEVGEKITFLAEQTRCM